MHNSLLLEDFKIVNRYKKELVCYRIETAIINKCDFLETDGICLRKT